MEKTKEARLSTGWNLEITWTSWFFPWWGGGGLKFCGRNFVFCAVAILAQDGDPLVLGGEVSVSYDRLALADNTGGSSVV